MLRRASARSVRRCGTLGLGLGGLGLGLARHATRKMEPVEPEPEPEPETPAAPIGLLPDPCCFDAWPAPLEGDPSVAARFGASGYTILPRIIRAEQGC